MRPREAFLSLFFTDSGMTGQGAGAPHEGAILRINVGGFRRRLLSTRLSRFPETRLARLLQCQSKESILELCDDYDDLEKEFYFDRNPALFPYVLHFYNTGRLHVMAELCIFSFSQEIEYWGINELFIDSCCSGRYHCRKMEPEQTDWDDKSEEGSCASSLNEIVDFYNKAGKFDKQPLGSVRRRTWLMMENPGYSLPSRVFSVFSILVVLGSVATMCMNSMSEFTLLDGDGRPCDNPRFETVERFGIGWFTFELLARFVVAPDLLHFFQQPLNLIDLVSILPFYLTLMAKLVAKRSPAMVNLGRVALVLRLMRVFRILKLARHSTGLRSLGTTLRNSYREIGLLLLYLAVSMSFFSVMVYTVEKEYNDGLSTIPASWWWATVSMTTVGYGDMVPGSVVGKLMASACILAGILVVVLPITLIFNKFSLFYKRQKQLESIMKSCHFDGGIKEAPSVNLRNYYTHKVKALMASLSNMSRRSASNYGLSESSH